jgi:hypothetical protein
MMMINLCLLACILLIAIAAPHQYYQDYLNKSIEIELYRSFVLPPLGCGPAAKKLSDIGWIEWSGHTIWKYQSNEQCMLYVSKVTQTPWPNLFSTFMKATGNVLEMPFLLISSPLFWCFIALALPGFLVFKQYYSSTAAAVVPQNLIINELNQIFRGDEILNQQFLHSSDLQ